MNAKRNLKTLFAAVCCFALLLVPISSHAQGIVKGVQHGVEGAANKTKEGAEAVGHETKKVITGDQSTSSQSRMKSGETQPGTTTTETQTQQTTEQTQAGNTGRKHMPRTAGELPLLALTGLAALAGARATRRLK